MNKRIFWFALVGALIWVRPVLAQTCGVVTLNSSCTYLSTGTPSKAGYAAGLGPVAEVGTITFNGTGGVSFDVDVNDNGRVAEDLTGSGTYTVQPDCDGQVVVTLLGLTRTLSFQIGLNSSSQAAELKGLDSGSSLFPSGPLEQVIASNCTF